VRPPLPVIDRMAAPASNTCNSAKPTRALRGGDNQATDEAAQLRKRCRIRRHACRDVGDHGPSTILEKKFYIARMSTGEVTAAGTSPSECVIPGCELLSGFDDLQGGPRRQHGRLKLGKFASGSEKAVGEAHGCTASSSRN
jgi:hypothetical protein